MGLLSMLIPVCNAQRILTEQEQADIDTFLYLQAKHETEIKALITTDTLYLVDRKYVYAYKGYHISYDNTKVIPLTSKEKQTITDAYKEGTLGISVNDVVNYAAIPTFYTYLFVTGDTFILSYNYGIFKQFLINGDKKSNQSSRNTVLTAFPKVNSIEMYTICTLPNHF